MVVTPFGSEAVPLNTEGFPYDFVLSYAGEDNEYALDLYEHLTQRGASVYYAPKRQAEILGRNLPEYLTEVFSKWGRFCIPFISNHYVSKSYPLLEWRTAFDRYVENAGVRYILPIRLDSSALPSLGKGIAYIDIAEGIDTIADTMIEALIAQDPLRSKLPSHWQLSRIHSPSLDCREKHWQVQIFEEKRPRSEFHLYLSGRGIRPRGRRVPVKIKHLEFHYLIERSVPVLLVSQDQNGEFNHWIWLHDHLKQTSTSLKRKGNITIYVPTSNILQNDLQKIEATAAWAYHQRVLKRRVELEHDPDYRYNVHSFGSGMEISVQPRHDRALEKRPITGKLHVDYQNAEKLQRALERGEAAHFSGRLAMEGLPDWFLPDSKEDMEIFVLPIVPEQRVHVSIVYLGEHDRTLFRSELVELKLVQSGASYKRWQGRGIGQPFIHTLAFDYSSRRASFNFTLSPEARNPIHFQLLADVLQQWSLIKKVVVTNLENGSAFTLTDFRGYTVDEIFTEDQLKLIRNLATIASHLQLDLSIPEKITVNEAKTAGIVAEIIETGQTSKLTIMPKEAYASEGSLSVISGVGTVQWALDVLKPLSAEGEVMLSWETSASFEIFGHTIDLGPAEYLYHVTKLLNEDELLALEKQGVSPDDELEVHLLGDIEHSYTRFIDWCKPSQQGPPDSDLIIPPSTTA